MPWFSDSAGPATPLAIARRPVLPSPSDYKVGNPIEEPTHDSGTWLVASLYHVEDFHLPIHAGFYRRFQSAPFMCALCGGLNFEWP